MLVWSRHVFGQLILQWVITDDLVIFLTAGGWIALRVTVHFHCINHEFCRSSKIGDFNYFSFPLSDVGWWEPALRLFFVQVENVSHEPDLHKHKSHTCRALKQCLKWSLRLMTLLWCDAQHLLLNSSLILLKQNLCSLGFLIWANIFNASLVLKLFCSESWHIGS